MAMRLPMVLQLRCTGMILADDLDRSPIKGLDTMDVASRIPVTGDTAGNG